MTTIYIVTEGEYSAYHIAAAFSSRDAAERYAELECIHRGPYPSVEVGEYPLYDTLPPLTITYTAVWLERHAGGTGIRVTKVASWGEGAQPPHRPEVTERDTYDGRRRISAVGDSEEAVRRSVADRVAAYLAHKEGVA